MVQSSWGRIIRHYRHKTSPPYSLPHNGTAEQNWRTLFDMNCSYSDEQVLEQPYKADTIHYAGKKTFPECRSLGQCVLLTSMARESLAPDVKGDLYRV